MKTTNTIAKFGAGTLAAVALTFGAAGIAGAQDTNPVDSDATTEESTDTVKRDGHGRHHGKKALVAEVLDITVEELDEQREAGATLAEIAGDQVDEVVDAIVNDIEARIAEGVENGRLTQEQADERLAEVEERVTERVETGVRGERGDGEGHRGPRRGDRGPRADVEAQETGLVES